MLLPSSFWVFFFPLFFSPVPLISLSTPAAFPSQLLASPLPFTPISTAVISALKGSSTTSTLRSCALFTLSAMALSRNSLSSHQHRVSKGASWKRCEGQRLQGGLCQQFGLCLAGLWCREMCNQMRGFNCLSRGCSCCSSALARRKNWSRGLNLTGFTVFFSSIDCTIHHQEIHWRL